MVVTTQTPQKDGQQLKNLKDAGMLRPTGVDRSDVPGEVGLRQQSTKTLIPAISEPEPMLTPFVEGAS